MNRRKIIRNASIIGTGAILGMPLISRYTTAKSAEYPMRQITTTQVGDIKIHCLTSGMVKVKRSHKNPSIGFAAILLDPFWTEWLPIHVWVIEHPEGNILIDTGENQSVNDKGYFDCDKINGAVYRTILKFDISSEGEINYLLSQINMTPSDIRWVVLTHLHLDHVDGVQFFPKAEFVVHKSEYEVVSPGHVRCLLPSWFNPRLVSFENSGIAGFERSYALTNSKDVICIPTPGHTHGHQSVVLRVNNYHIVFAGDASFTQDQIIHEKVAGICADKKAAKDSIHRIRTLAKAYPTIYLPTHDPESAQRLSSMEVLDI